MNPNNLTIIEWETPAHLEKSEILRGLTSRPKKLPCHLLYDERGSALFEQICETPEYYLTRTEIAILQEHGSALAELMGISPVIIEPGAGNLKKAELLLRKISNAVFRPIDISSLHLIENARRVAHSHPNIVVEAIVGSFSDPSQWSSQVRREDRNILFFPGSTIGNFEPGEVVHFLSQCRNVLGRNAAAIIGVDLKKDESRINAAYNDSKGITAEFEKNVLLRINREYGATFHPEKFNYKGFYNPELGRVEMYLESRIRHSVEVGANQIEINELELIHLENSYKYAISEFQSLACSAGWKPVTAFTDQQSLFSVHFLEVEVESSGLDPFPFIIRNR